LQSERINLTVDFCAGNAFDLNEFTERVATIFGHQFTLHHEGESPEYIRFHASPHAMEEVFGFQPKIALPTGMRRFATWIQTQSRISAYAESTSMTPLRMTAARKRPPCDPAS